jgi:hypothetical protein
MSGRPKQKPPASLPGTTMELESTLLACGFDEADAQMIMGEFMTGIANVGEAMGEDPERKIREYLTGEQVAEILHKALDDRIATLSESERAGINLEMLLQAFGYD